MLLSAHGQSRVGALVIGLVVVSVSVVTFRLQDLGGFGSATWWMVLLLISVFVIVDLKVVDVRVRAETLAFTFIELPLFIGALFMPPLIVWGAMTIGVAIAAFGVRRNPLVKGSFNVANAAFQGAIGLWIFHEMVGAGAGAPFGPRIWIAATVAAIVSSGLSAGLLLLAMLFVQGRDAASGVGVTLFLGAVTSVTNVSLALISASLIDYRPLALVLLIIPTVVLYGAYSAFVSERAQRERVQGMHELALEVRSIRDASTILPVLRLALEHLDADQAELSVLPDDRGGAQARRFVIGAGQEYSLAMDAREVAEVVEASQTVPMSEVHDGDNKLIGVLHSKGRPLGVLTIGAQARDTEFSAGDRSMFETMVEQLGLAFENNQLGRAVTQLERRGRQLQHEANHDVLTGLANRAFLAAKLDAEFEADRTPSLMYVDLDDFKEVNDKYGHGAGDEVLRVIARRFESVVGNADDVARVGGDEFVVLLRETADDAAIAQSLLDVATEPIDLAEGRVQIRASIGIARARANSDSATLLKRADVAMYSAKEQGKGKLAFSKRGR